MIKQPKEIIVLDSDGNEKTFIIGKIPADEGLKIVSSFPEIMSSRNRDMTYETSKKLIMLGCFVEVSEGDKSEIIPLDTANTINNHLDATSIVYVADQILSYNFGFFPKAGMFQQLIDSIGSLASMSKIGVPFVKKAMERLTQLLG